MYINLLAGSAMGLFVGLLIVMVIVVLLFGLLTFLIFRQHKKPAESANVYDVKRMLVRRETQLTIEIMNNKDDEAKKTEFVNKLRRVKSAQALVDELLAEEKAISGISDSEEETKQRPRPAKVGQRPVRPARKPAEGKPAANSEGKTAEGQPQSVKPAEQPVVKSGVKVAKPPVKKKDDKEFKPSEK